LGGERESDKLHRVFYDFANYFFGKKFEAELSRIEITQTIWKLLGDGIAELVYCLRRDGNIVVFGSRR
jgi:hypothetical protein